MGYKGILFSISIAKLDAFICKWSLNLITKKNNFFQSCDNELQDATDRHDAMNLEGLDEWNVDDDDEEFGDSIDVSEIQKLQ